MRTLLVDNHDSFTDNLARLVAAAFGARPVVFEHDDPALRSLDLTRFAAVLVGPGPGRPQAERDVRWARWVVETCPVPLLGVCLGHQLIAVVEGGRVELAPQPRHGHVERVRHTGEGPLRDLPQGFRATRYHSLHVAPPLPATLEATAWAADGVVMALRHRERPVWGVQFHPESVATEGGLALVTAFRDLAVQRRPGGLPEPGSGRPGTPPAPRAPVRTRPRMGVHRVALPYAADTRALAEHVLAAAPGDAFWLDTSRRHPALGRHSFVGDGGGPYGESLRYRVGSGGVQVVQPDGARGQVGGSVFDVLAGRLAERAEPLPAGVPAPLGGYVGWFGYECKADAGALSPHHARTPDSAWVGATRVVDVDHEAGTTVVAALVGDDEGGAMQAAAWVDAVLDVVRPAEPLAAPDPAPAWDGADLSAVLERWLDRGHERYLSDVRACREALCIGESYELCLTDLARLPFAGDPLRGYLRQRAASPAPYGAFLRLAGVSVLCASPERFLAVGRDGWAESRPIKGTAARDPDPLHDTARAAALADDPKARAENLMVVDLVRHDLGLVSDEVEVPTLNAVETQPTVHHLVSTVRGRLRAGASAVAAARACFPPGSMTGAPKLRTMEVLDALETSARGVYSGALGWLGPAGDADLAVVIRTAVVVDGSLLVGAGGAVVLDSDPEAEWQEMLLKAAVPLRGLLPAPPG